MILGFQVSLRFREPENWTRLEVVADSAVSLGQPVQCIAHLSKLR